MTPHVVISDAKSTTVDHDVQREVLAEFGATVSSEITRTEDEVLAMIDDVAGLIVDAGVPVTPRILECAEALQVVGRAGIGVDNVDLQAAEREGVTVVHNPTYCIDEVATHALGLLLSGLRKLPTFDRQTRNGGWNWGEGQPIARLQGSTLGFLGFGKIPRRLSTMVQGFGCDMIAYDPYLAANIVRTHNVEPVGFQKLLASVDLLSIHTPLTEETRGMIDEAALEHLNDDAVLVNTARGPVIDSDALVDALREGRIGFACLDVTDPEPLPAGHALASFDNTLITPHLAWYSEASREQLSIEIAEDVGAVLTGDVPTHPVTTETPWI